MATGLVLVALALLAPLSHAAEDFLEPEIAFKFSARMIDEKTAEISYRIADGYYMYREAFKFKAEGATLGEPLFPPGKVKFDETFQKDVESYRKTVAITIPVTAGSTFTLRSTGQGCADKGLCYPPMESVVKLSIDGSAPAMSTAGMGSAGAQLSSPDTEMGRIEASLQSGKLLVILPLFLLLGIGLSFTPCVLPMVPILSSIVAASPCRQRIRSAWRSCIPRSAWPLGWQAKGWRLRCRTPGCWAPLPY
jgi:thiol:disulfide interchange protein DsbD